MPAFAFPALTNKLSYLKKNNEVARNLKRGEEMGKINEKMITDTVVEIIKKAQMELPSDVILALQNAKKNENNPTAIAQLDAILKNIEIAGKKKIPMCQDTGILVFFVEVGKNVKVDFDLDGSIREGVRLATKTVPLRPNAVHPLTRKNSQDNTGNGLPDINYSFTDGDRIKITVLPKGAGSENMSVLKMLKPSEKDQIEKFVLETVFSARGNPCPPVVIGIGIGGSFDKAARMAKHALLRELGNMNDFEKHLTDIINSLEIGPMGLGGATYALEVHIEEAYCHTASLPIAINFNCWAARRASIEIGGEKNE